VAVSEVISGRWACRNDSC